jgi:hypothetical protein
MSFGERIEGPQEEGQQESSSCYICLDSDPPAIKPGCACRALFVHPECLMIQAKYDTEAWHTCGICKQDMKGPMRTTLAKAWVAYLRRTIAPQSLHEAQVHLARTHIADGRYTDAERIIREELTGPVSVGLMSTMGECLQSQGRYADAERTYRALVASIDDKSSYESLCARQSLGRVLLETNAKEAESIHQAVFDAARRVMKPESIDVMSYTGDLALAMLYNDRTEEAERMLDELVGRLTRVLGPDHPDTLTAKGNLALALYRLGRDSEAASIQTAILAALITTRGPDHPSAVLCKANLADYLARSSLAGSLQRAVRMAREVLDANRRVLGPEHPDTLVCALNLANLLMSESSGAREAEEIVRTTLAMLERSGLPASGMHRSGASTVLAGCMYQQGKTAEAVDTMRGLASSCRAELGEHSASTIAANTRLEYMSATDRAATMSSQGHLEEAKWLQIGVLRTLQRVLGPTHQHTVLAKGNLEYTLRCAQAQVPVTLVTAVPSKASKAARAVKPEEAAKAEAVKAVKPARLNSRPASLCSNPECTKDGPRPCSRCHTASYCTQECQKAHWKAHQLSCHHHSLE